MFCDGEARVCEAPHDGSVRALAGCWSQVTWGHVTCVGCVCPRPTAQPRGLGRVHRVISGQVWSPGFPRLPAKSRGVASEKKGHTHLQSKQAPLYVLGVSLGQRASPPLGTVCLRMQPTSGKAETRAERFLSTLVKPLGPAMPEAMHLLIEKANNWLMLFQVSLEPTDASRCHLHLNES